VHILSQHRRSSSYDDSSRVDEPTYDFRGCVTGRSNSFTSYTEIALLFIGKLFFRINYVYCILVNVYLKFSLQAVGTFSTIAIVLAVLTRAAIDGDISEQIAEKENFDRLKPLHTLWDTSGLPISFGLIAYAFSGHAVVPSIYKSMKNTQEFEKVVNITFAGVTFCCLIVALSGYHMFGATVDDQVTLSLQKSEPGGSSKAMMLLTWLMILTAFSKFTLTAFPLALGLEEIVAIWIPSDRVMEVVSSFIKICLISLALLVAIFIPSFSFLCSLVGLVCTMIVSVIFPAAAHLRLFGTRLPLWEKIIDCFFILCGVVMAIAGTYATVN